MSDSTPSTPAASASKTPPRRRSRLADVPWFLYSLIGHGLILVVLWFTPVGQMIVDEASAPKPKSRVTPEQVERIVEATRTSAELQVREMLEQMRETESAMRQDLSTMTQQYQQQATELSLQAPEQALLAQLQTLAEQRQALEDAQWAQEKFEAAAQPPPPDADDATKALAEKTAKADYQEALDTQAQTTVTQGSVGESQRQVQTSLAFTNTAFDEVRAKQTDAVKAQEAAAEAQDKARELEDAKTSTEAHIERLQENQKRTEDRVETLAKALAKETAQLAKDTEAAAKAAQDLATAKEQAATAAEGKDKAKAEANVKKATERAQRDAKRAEDTTKKVDNRADQVAKETAKAEDAAKAVTEAQAKLEATLAELDGAQERAVEEQKKAIAAQQDAAAQLKATMQAEAQKAADAAAATTTTAVAATTTSAPPPLPASTTAALTPEQQAELKKLDIAALYEEARAIEQRTAELYRQIRATEAAVKQQAPLEQTLANTQVPLSDRRDVDTELLRAAIQSTAEAESHREELASAKQEIADMVATTQRLQALVGASAMGSGTGTGMSVSLADMRAQADTDAQFEALAAKDDGARYKNLADAMRQAAGEGEGTGATGASSIYQGVGSSDGIYGMASPDPKASPARRFARTGASRPSWVYVDAWYIIGPFPNPGRRNIDTKFPPESVVDLDAVYVIPDGRKVAWTFQNSPKAGIRPAQDEPFAIFYCYTELWFEEAADLTIAVGADDYSQVWINDLQVWNSSKARTAWNADEGFRTVHFRKGLNRVLCRLENGPHGSVYSLMICLDPAAKQ